jgi:hypothetical protein
MSVERESLILLSSFTGLRYYSLGITSSEMESSNAAGPVLQDKTPEQERCLIMNAIAKTVAAVLFSWALLTLPTVAQKSPYGLPDRTREQRSLAFNMVRAINAAEANYKLKHGAYATWDTLYNSGDFTSTGTKWAPESLPTVSHAMYGSGPEIVPGWRLRLTISKDGNAYDLQLEDVTDTKCHYAVTSDERGIVRQGKSVDCPA